MEKKVSFMHKGASRVQTPLLCCRQHFDGVCCELVVLSEDLYEKSFKS